MAYVSQERKAELAPKIKEVLKKYGMKGSISIQHYSTLVVKVQSGSINWSIIQGEVNTENQKEYKTYENFHRELEEAMNMGNHNNSDSQTDYFDVGWYISIKMGTWNKPYIYQP